MSLPLKLLLGSSVVLVSTYAALLGWQQWTDSHRIIAGPQNQSAFYRVYDPEEILKRFRSPKEGYGEGFNSGAVQDTEFIRHSKSFEREFTIESRRKTELVAAIDQQIQNELQLPGTHPVNRVEEPSGNFKYNYTTPNGGGFIVVHLPVYCPVQRNMALPDGLEDLCLKINLEETWNRPTSRD
jgi:hypothetical protein